MRPSNWAETPGSSVPAVSPQIVHSEKTLLRLDGLENLHPFDTGKYMRIYDRLLLDGLVGPGNTHVPEPAPEEDLLRVHTRRYLAGLEAGYGVSEALEFPELGRLDPAVLAESVVMPHRIAAGGTILAARLALDHGVAVNLGGGYHHAMPDRGEGFCLFADVPAAIRSLQARGGIHRALIVDLDVHQGNGSAVICADDESVFTFSMHQKDIYPMPKEFSDRDVELDAGCGDATYLGLLGEYLPKVHALSEPDMVFLVAGADVLAGDLLAGLSITPEGLVQRDWQVVSFCLERGIPVVMTLAGGYGPESWKAQYLSVRNILLKTRDLRSLSVQSP
jgi:histone deacetylase 11